MLCNFLEADNSKGIAISHDGLMCSGFNANQDFNICTKGTGQIYLRNNTSISGSLGWIAFHSRMCHTFCEAPMKQTEACPWGCQIFVAQRRRRRRQGGRPSLPPNSTRVATRGVPTKETTHASCCLRRPVDRPTTRLPATCRRPRAQPGPVCGASYMRFPHQSSFRSPFEFSAA